MDLILSGPVALFIFALTIVTSLLAFNPGTHLLDQFIFRPYSVARGKRLHTLLTHGLIHADGIHLAFNMFSFFFFAFYLEYIWVRQGILSGHSPLFGHCAFLAIYVIGLVASCAGTLVKHRNDADYMSLGASGAITAVIFSFVIFEPLSSIYFFVIPVPAPIYAIVYLVGSHYAARHDRVTRINHDSHFWGAISGLACTFILAPGAYTAFIQTIVDFLRR